MSSGPDSSTVKLRPPASTAKIALKPTIPPGAKKGPKRRGYQCVALCTFLAPVLLVGMVALVNFPKEIAKWQERRAALTGSAKKKKSDKISKDIAGKLRKYVARINMLCGNADELVDRVSTTSGGAGGL